MRTFVVGDIHGRCAQLLNLLDMLPREPHETLVFLGDLIDRGSDIPGCVEHVIKLCREDPDHVICLRGNHEQMLLDFVDQGASLWLTQSTGSEFSFEQYTSNQLRIESEKDFSSARSQILGCIPQEHLKFIRATQFF